MAKFRVTIGRSTYDTLDVTVDAFDAASAGNSAQAKAAARSNDPAWGVESSDYHTVEAVKQPKPKYNHAFSLGFSIDTDCSCKDFDNYPTPAAMIAALRHRIDDLNKHHEGVHEAVGEPIDTYLNEEME
jgi:hypothetical protein